MPHTRPPLALFAGLMLILAAPAIARPAAEAFDATRPEAPVSGPPNGAIFREADYAALTSGMRAARVGDVLTIMLVERMSASKASSSSTDRGGGIALTPPSTGPLSFLKGSDIGSSGQQNFKGKGESAQSNALTGEISVTIAALLPNQTMLVRGEKLVTLNRGEERVQFSGIVRMADILPDNRVLSTRVADARVRYFGKGHVASASRPGWLQRVFAKISPF